MPSTNTTSKFATHGTYGLSEKFTQLRHDLISSAAFLTLKAIEQIILIDWIRVYNEATNYDRDESKITKPVIYTFGSCAVVVSKNTFYRAMRSLQLHGFVVDYNGTDYKRGYASRWLATTRWISWKPDQAQFRLLTGYRDRRAASVTDSAQLNFSFVTYMHQPRLVERGPRDSITSAGSVANEIVEELCNKNDSRHQAQPKRQYAR